MPSFAPSVRLTVTRRNLLEWTTAAQTEAQPDLDLAGFYRAWRPASWSRPSPGSWSCVLQPSAIPGRCAVSCSG